MNNHRQHFLDKFIATLIRLFIYFIFAFVPLLFLALFIDIYL